MRRCHTAGKTVMQSHLLPQLLLPVLLVACGPGTGGPPDGDAGTDAADTGIALTALEIPWLAEGAPPIAAPTFTPCPAGWHEVVEAGPESGMDVVTCDPYGDTPGGTEPDTCPGGWAHFLGDDGCSPVGAPCPTEDFPEGLPPDADILYVLSSAAPGGDGTRAAPFVAITDAINRASAGTVIAIGKGDYDEALRLPRGITLWGACAAETRLTASSPGPLAQGVITVPSADTHLVNLRIGPAELPGLAAYGTGTSVSVAGLVIEGVRRYGLYADRGAQVSGRELSVSGTRGDSTGRFGRGLVVQTASAVDLTRLVVFENRELGALASDEGTTLTLTDVVLRDTQAQQSDREFGRGLSVQLGATATITRALVSRNRDVGLFASDEGTSLTLTDVVVRETRSTESDGSWGRGLSMRAGAAVMITRAVFTRNRDVGVFAAGEGTSLTLSDVVVEDTQGRESEGTWGRGLNVQEGAAATVTRAVLTRNREIGVIASGSGTSLTLTDSVVGDTRPRETDGTGGRGMTVQTGATAVVTRAVFTQNRDIGVLANDEATSLTLSDVVVSHTQAGESHGEGGRGLGVQLGATAVVTRALFLENRDIGVVALGGGATVELLDVVVAGTTEQACAATSCAGRPFGVGLVGALDASLTARRFEVLDSVLCGVMLALDGQVDLSMGQVSGSQIGVCLQVDGYSVARLTDGVRYVENGMNLDTTSLPVPASFSGIGEMK